MVKSSKWLKSFDFKKLDLQMGYVHESPFVILMKDNGQLVNSRSMDRCPVNRSIFKNEWGYFGDIGVLYICIGHRHPFNQKLRENNDFYEKQKQKQDNKCKNVEGNIK